MTKLLREAKIVSLNNGICKENDDENDVEYSKPLNTKSKSTRVLQKIKG